MTVTLGLHMICRSETDRLRACLESMKPVAFDQIVVGITGKDGWEGETRKIVEEYGEAVDLTWLPKFQFEDYGECIASFAQARQVVYNKLATDWAFWIDADDTLDGAEQLRPLVETIDAKGFGCLMLPYFYGFDDNGNCITILTRERAVKRSIGWKWVRRVHEGMMVQGPCQFAKAPDVIIRHNSPTGRGWPMRNLKLLMMDYEEDPNDKRTLCYIGHQYYAVQDWASAAIWYERYVQVEDQVIEKWQALHFLADCYRLTGHTKQAIQSDLNAAILIPEWADPYFGLAETFARAGNWDATIWWDKVGRAAQVPDAAIFTNPLDYTYNPALFVHLAHFNKGDLEKGRQVVEDALQIAPKSEHLQERYQYYNYAIALKQKADALLSLWEGAPDEVVLQTPVPNALTQVSAVKQRIGKAAFNTRRTDSPWCVMFCGQSLEPWGPPSITEGGIGGSETAVIHMARLLGERGWHVDVFNIPDKYVGQYGPVGYWPYDWYEPKWEPDLFIGWRSPGLHMADYDAQGKVKWLWVHDLHMGNTVTEQRARHFDRIMGVSQWHSDYLQMCYPFLNNLKPTRNGIDLARFDQTVERNSHKVVYASSPDRGLSHLLMIWPHIVAAVPDAELNIFYGWQGIDKFPQLAYLKQQIEFQLAHTPNVTWRGRLNQNELAKEFLSAGCWFYPTNFLEVSCITAMECMAAGVAILASACGALPETVGDRGILVPGECASDVYVRMFVGHATSLLNQEHWRKEWATKGLVHAPNLAWEGVADEWLEAWGATVG